MNLTALSLLLLSSAAQAAPSEPPSPHQHTAVCVAAMKPRIEELARQLRAGDERVEPELVRLAESTFAFIGLAYKGGLRKPEADRLLADAEEAQKALPSAELANRARACQAEGASLLAAANAVERAVAAAAVKVRIRKLRG